MLDMIFVEHTVHLPLTRSAPEDAVHVVKDGLLITGQKSGVLRPCRRNADGGRTGKSQAGHQGSGVVRRMRPERSQIFRGCGRGYHRRGRDRKPILGF